MIENLSLVIFDMDGLMFDSERIYCEVTLKAADKFHIDVDKSVLYNSVGSSFFDTDKFFPHGIPDGVEIDCILEDAIKDAVNDMCANGVPKKPGLDELMEILKKKDVKMAVATSTPIERSGRLLESAGIMSMLDFVITSAEVERGKPYPDIFLKTCEKAGVFPEMALVLEDSNNGGMAARSAGIKYIIVPDINEPTEDVASLAYAVVENLFDVSNLIFADAEKVK